MDSILLKCHWQFVKVKKNKIAVSEKANGRLLERFKSITDRTILARKRKTILRIFHRIHISHDLKWCFIVFNYCLVRIK